MTSFRKADVEANPNVQNNDILSITLPTINRMKVEGKSEQTITAYVRAVERLVRFHGLIHPKELDIDEALDFLVSLSEANQEKSIQRFESIKRKLRTTARKRTYS